MFNALLISEVYTCIMLLRYTQQQIVRRMTTALPAAVRHGARAREWLQLLISFVCATAKDARTEQHQLSITAAAAAAADSSTATTASASGKADPFAAAVSATQGQCHHILLVDITHDAKQSSVALIQLTSACSAPLLTHSSCCTINALQQYSML
jgi:hypothetical protein